MCKARGCPGRPSLPGSRPAPVAHSRRAVLLAAVGLTGAALLAPAGPAARAAGATAAPGSGTLVIRPRSDWAGDLAPRGPLEVEAPGDVRFLLVHHTASPNGYAVADVPGLLRGFYRFHTGPEKGWPDIAYNFLVDAFGGVWEGRAGSREGPVRGSATGGSQGHALLCCYIGDFTATAPTPAAEAAMLALLAGLADTYGVDTTPGAVAQFVSRGSNRHPAGSPVTTSTISTHRQMSRTACPGDVVHSAVHSRYQAEVTALRARAVPPAPAEPHVAAPGDGGAAGTPIASPPPGPSPTAVDSTTPVARHAVPLADPRSVGAPIALTAAGGAVVATAVAAGVVGRRARRGGGRAGGSSDPARPDEREGTGP